MSTITLNNITSGYNVNKINDNFTTILNSINTDLIHVSGGQNVMGQDLDLNSKNLLNVNSLNAANIYIGGSPLSTSPFILTPGSITDTQISNSAGISSSKLNFLQAGTGAVVRTIQAKSRDVVSVKDFGALGDGVHDDTNAFLLAIAYLNIVVAGQSGGRIKIPSGKYKLTQPIPLTTVSGGWNIILSGEGPASTVLDFTSAPAGSDGIRVVGGGNFCSIEDLFLQGAPQDGIVLGYGTGAPNAGPFASDLHIRNVTVASCGRHGFSFYNTFMFEMANCLSFNNGGSGIVFNGFHTSCHVTRSWARNNNGANWILNGLAYSSFTTCGADQSTTSDGWSMSNLRGVTLTACGAESNAKNGWYIFTSTTSTTGLFTIQQDIHGLTFVGCNGFSNSLAIPGAYGTVATISTSNARPIDLRWIGGDATPATTSDPAFNISGTSGRITQKVDGLNYAGFTQADIVAGDVVLTNAGIAGFNATVQLASAFACPNNVTTVVPWSSTFVSNPLNCTYNGGTNGVVIPVGVNRVKVSASLDFASTSTVGVRQAFIRKNGGGLLGLPSINLTPPSAGDVWTPIQSTIMNVVAGDYLTVLAFQNSGAPLNINNSTGSWLSIEAVG